jgi:DNA-binding SARP family transcriptional activator
VSQLQVVQQLQVVRGPDILLGGARLPIPAGAERLTVLIALRGSTRRRTVATLLWPNADPQRRAGNLRSAVWRLRSAHLDLIAEVDGRLSIRPDVRVDVRALDPATGGGQHRQDGDAASESASLQLLVDATNLLPGWYDEWLVADRERIRALALDALDRRSRRLSRSGSWAEAIDAALVAVTCDPLRESSQVALLHAYLGEGNVVEARRAYQAYRVQLGTEVGIDPSSELARMVTAAG